MQIIVHTRLKAYLTITVLAVMSILCVPDEAIEKNRFRMAGLMIGTASQEVDETQDTLADAQDIADQKQLAAEEVQRKRKLWKDVLVYSCFGFSLIMLLWMRKRRTSNTKGNMES